MLSRGDHVRLRYCDATLRQPRQDGVQEVETPQRRGRLVRGGVLLVVGVALFLVGLGQESTRGTANMIVGGMGVLVGAVLLVRPGASSTDTRPGSDGLSGPAFVVALRGYDRIQVDELVRRADEALRSSSIAYRCAVRAEIESTSLGIGLRGYTVSQVDEYLKRASAALASPPEVRSPDPAS